MNSNDMKLQASFGQCIVPHPQLTLLFLQSLYYRSKVKTNSIAIHGAF